MSRHTPTKFTCLSVADASRTGPIVVEPKEHTLLVVREHGGQPYDNLAGLHDEQGSGIRGEEAGRVSGSQGKWDGDRAVQVVLRGGR